MYPHINFATNVIRMPGGKRAIVRAFRSNGKWVWTFLWLDEAGRMMGQTPCEWAVWT